MNPGFLPFTSVPMKRRLRTCLLCAAVLLPVAPCFSAVLQSDLPVPENHAQISPGDAFAWALLAVLGLTFGLVTACGLGIYRQFRRVTPETELLEEIKQAARKTTPILPLVTPSSQTAPWERPADWWKNDPQD